MSTESVMPSNHLIFCSLLFLLPSLFPSIWVFSNELAIHIKWPQSWSFSFSISPSSEYSGLISFRIDWKYYYKQSLWRWWTTELFQILKDDAMKVLHSICQQIWKTQQWPQDWKRSVFILIPKRGSAKECPKYHTITFTSHARKVMSKIFQARL